MALISARQKTPIFAPRYVLNLEQFYNFSLKVIGNNISADNFNEICTFFRSFRRRNSIILFPGLLLGASEDAYAANLLLK